MEYSFVGDMSGAEIIYRLDAHDMACLRDCLGGEAEEKIRLWYSRAPVDKPLVCKQRMLEFWIPKLRERELAIPSNDADLIDLILSQPDYVPAP